MDGLPFRVQPWPGAYAASQYGATTGKARKGMKRSTVIGVLAVLIWSAAASAAPTVAWTKKDMKTAVRAIGYPKPHPKKLACKGVGAADTTGRFSSFRCTATYKHHSHRRFVIAGQGEGGWLCAGRTLMGCKLLRHGFVTTAETADGLEGSAELAAVGYMQNRYGITSPYRTGLCTQAGATAWTCGYKTTDTSAVNVTITFKRVKGGDTFTAAAAAA